MGPIVGHWLLWRPNKDWLFEDEEVLLVKIEAKVVLWHAEGEFF